MTVEVAYQTALYTVLNDAREALGVVGVYDIAPQPDDGGNVAAFPYIVIGRNFTNQLDTQTKEGFEVTSRIHVFSRTGSMLECKRIQGGIYSLLHRKPMDVAGFNCYSLLRNDSDCLSDQDGKVHGVCEYVGLVEDLTDPGFAFDAGFDAGFNIWPL